MATHEELYRSFGLNNMILQQEQTKELETEKK